MSLRPSSKERDINQFAAGADLAMTDELRARIRELEREIKILRMANAELERIAMRDTLTPLSNRRHLISSLNERIQRMNRYGARAAVIFVDVDNMKTINDRHGHAAGDFALVHIAALLQAQVRATDVAARIGGDEFALILDEIDDEECAAKVQSLREIIRGTPCRFDDVDIPVGASFGMAVIKAGESDLDVLGRADSDMYAAKEERRASERTGGR